MPTSLSIKRKSLERIADAVPALIAMYSLKTGDYIYVNKAITRILGYTPEKFLAGGMEFAISLMHHDDLARTMEKNQQALAYANEQSTAEDEIIASFEYRMRHKNGEWRWLHTDGTVFKRDSKGQVELILNVSLDITDRKRAEQQLKRSLKALETVLVLE